LDEITAMIVPRKRLIMTITAVSFEFENTDGITLADAQEKF
jgi:hypothetical protein